jgi:hypothetical protein
VKRATILVLLIAVLGASADAQEYIDLVPKNITIRPSTDQDDRYLRSVAVSMTFGEFDHKATSSLPADSGGSYGPDKARDGSLATGWAEGERGNGAGVQYFTYYRLPWDTDEDTHLYVFPGWGSSADLWARNNRIREAEITVYGMNQYTVTGALDIAFMKTVEVFTVEFQDQFAYQGIPIRRYLIQQDGHFARGITHVMVRIEIKSTYAGSSWDDTVIAEIEFTDGSQQPLPPYDGP